METITSLEKLKNLKLPTAIYLQLIQQLIKPFDSDLQAAVAFWMDTGTQLILLDPEDRLDAMTHDPHGARKSVEFALTYLEQVSSLGVVDGDIHDDADNESDPNYLLVLSITSDGGTGTYLLLPSTHPEYSNLLNQKGA